MSSQVRTESGGPKGSWMIMVAAVVALVLLAGCRARMPLATPTPAATAKPQQTPPPIALPKIELANRDVAWGDEVMLIGTGWPGGAEVVIELLPLFADEGAAGAQTVSTVTASEGGLFEFRFFVPTGADWDTAPGAIIRAWDPDTGQDALVVLRLLHAVETPSPVPSLTPTPEPTAPSPSPTASPTVRPTPSPSPTAVSCSSRASFVADLTVPDNTYVEPGRPFVKTWRLRNSGTCTWTTDYALVHSGGDRLGSASAVSLGASVAPGSTVDVSVSMTAPTVNGVFESRWMLRSDEGRLFGTGANAGGSIWVRIRVGPTPIPTPAISAWRGDYFANANLAGTPKLTRDDAAVSFDWAVGAPVAGLPSDNFSVRWTRAIWFDQGLYRFHALVDDGVRVYMDGVLVIDSWKDGARREVTGDIAVSSGNHTVRVEYYERTGGALIRVWWETTTSFPDWRGEYWSNRKLSGNPTLVRNDVQVDFNWMAGAPSPALPVDGFSARWRRDAVFESATYRFRITVDDGARLWVDDKLVIDAWSDGSLRDVTADLALVSGSHRVRLEYYENVGDARIRLVWEKVAAPSYADWKGEYWSNRKLSGNPALVRNDAQVDFNWRAGAPSPLLPADGFSARWTRTVNLEAATYRFRVTVDDGVRLWVDGKLVIDDWQDGSARDISVEHAAAAGQHQVRLEYYENVGDARIRLAWERITAPSYPDWKGEYWSNRKLSGNPALVRNDAAIDFAWGSGSAAAGLPADNFSARWTRQQKFDNGVYRIQARADDGIRVYLDGELLIDKWQDSSGGTTYKVDVPINAGQHTLRVEYYERTGQAQVSMWWKRVSDLPTPSPVPNRPPEAVDDGATTNQDTPVAINVLANDIDPDGDDLQITAFSVTSKEGGDVNCTGAGWCTYTPLPAFVGSDSFTYVVSDGRGGSSTGTVRVEVKQVTPDGPPVTTGGVVVSELLAVPALGAIDGEWIELHNDGNDPVDLSGWYLEHRLGASRPFQIPLGTTIQPGAFLLLEAATTDIYLEDWGGTVRLLRPDWSLADSVTFGPLEAGASYSRDDEGYWHPDWPASPGAPNLPNAAYRVVNGAVRSVRNLLAP